MSLQKLTEVEFFGKRYGGGTFEGVRSGSSILTYC